MKSPWPLGFSRWPKINSTCPIDSMKTNFKSEVDWGNGFQDFVFTSIIFDSTYISKVRWHHKPHLKSIGETILKISHSMVSIAYILKSSMVAILVFEHGPKSIASVL